MWKAMGNVWKVWRGVWEKKTKPPPPRPIPKQYPPLTTKKINYLVFGFLFHLWGYVVYGGGGFFKNTHTPRHTGTIPKQVHRYRS